MYVCVCVCVCVCVRACAIWYLSEQLTNTIREMARLAHTNMLGLDREHALMLTSALPALMLNHLQVHTNTSNDLSIYLLVF
jgi:hypothetical protein